MSTEDNISITYVIRSVIYLYYNSRIRALYRDIRIDV